MYRNYMYIIMTSECGVLSPLSPLDSCNNLPSSCIGCRNRGWIWWQPLLARWKNQKRLTWDDWTNQRLKLCIVLSVSVSLLGFAVSLKIQHVSGIQPQRSLAGGCNSYKTCLHLPNCRMVISCHFQAWYTFISCLKTLDANHLVSMSHLWRIFPPTETSNAKGEWWRMASQMIIVPDRLSDTTNQIHQRSPSQEISRVQLYTIVLYSCPHLSHTGVGPMSFQSIFCPLLLCHLLCRTWRWSFQLHLWETPAHCDNQSQKLPQQKHRVGHLQIAQSLSTWSTYLHKKTKRIEK